MKLKSRSILTMFYMALTLTIGLSSSSSTAFSQRNTFEFDVDNINNIREQCDLDKVPKDTSVADVMLQFKQNNAFASEVEIIDQIREKCGTDKIPLGASVSDVLESFLGDNLLGKDKPTQVPISYGLTYLFAAAALLFVPVI